MGIVIQGTEMRELRCELTPAEVGKRAERVAELHEREETLEAQFATVRARHKANLEELHAERTQQLDEFRSKTELRQVLCELRLDFDAGRAELVRTDTGEVVYERPLSERERQRDLPFSEPDPGAEGHPATRTGSEGETSSPAAV